MGDALFGAIFYYDGGGMMALRPLYMVSPKKEELMRSSAPRIHARYRPERPGSSGLFGPAPKPEPMIPLILAGRRI